ncbi:MAG: hypothetical protein ACFE0P_02200 [Oceanicaulis sp.]
MTILLDLLHLVAAAALSLIGFGYERDEECNPVRFQPAAMVETVETPAGRDELRAEAVADCEAAAPAVRLPVL